MPCPKANRNDDDQWTVIDTFLSCRCGDDHQWCRSWFDGKWNRPDIISGCISDAVTTFDLNKLKQLDSCFGSLFPGHLRDYEVFGRLVSHWLESPQVELKELMPLLDYLRSIGECHYDLFDSIGPTLLPANCDPRRLLELVRHFIVNGQVNFLVCVRD
jgi:hypothetical protein